MKKNLYIVIGLIIILAIAVSLVFYFDKKQNKSLGIQNNTKNADEKIDDIESLKNNNQAAIDGAAKVNSGTIRNIDKTDHVWGKIGAPVEIIIYDDFECPFCAQFALTIEEVKEQFGDKVAIAFRHFPLRGHANAVPAAIASECAAEQDKFWEMHDKLFEANRTDSLGNASIVSDAEELGLDMDSFNSCFESEKYISKVQEHLDEGRKYGVSGTPGGFVNGEPIPGAYPFEDFTDSQGREREGLKAIIERHLEDKS